LQPIIIILTIFLTKIKSLMGLTYANIELVNGDDLSDFRRKRIGEDEIRLMTVNALVDTGSIMLCVNESIKEALGLDVVGRRRSQLANGAFLELDIVGPVTVRYLGRDCDTRALLLPDDAEPLLGAIPMEEMDLYVNPGRNELLPVHPEGPIMSLK
jgi:clan AA aspartic protease